MIVPEHFDDPLVRYSILSFFEDLFRVGVKVYRYRDGFMHQKVALSDDLTVVSTANLDNRSFRINFEISAVIADASFAEQTRAMLERDMAASVGNPRRPAPNVTLGTVSDSGVPSLRADPVARRAVFLFPQPVRSVRRVVRAGEHRQLAPVIEVLQDPVQVAALVERAERLNAHGAVA